MYTVKELARLTGLTPRTLRYYDAIGLLSPARNRDNDYRLYGGAEVDRLQEILLYREMGLPLEEIGGFWTRRTTTEPAPCEDIWSASWHREDGWRSSSSPSDAHWRPWKEMRLCRTRKNLRR